MPQLTVEIQDSLYSWLESEASERHVTLESLVNSIVRDNAVSSTKQERLLLSLFHNVSTRPGRTIPEKQLWVSWGMRGTRKEFEAAVEGLVSKGLLAANPDLAAYTLTVAGFARGQEA
jgi:hypothetical protein